MWLSYPSHGVHKTILYLYPKKLNGGCYFSFMGAPLVALESKPPCYNLRELIQMISLRFELNCAMYSEGNYLNMIPLHGLISSESVRLREMRTRSCDDSSDSDVSLYRAFQDY
jgi:hypothetical protein